VLVLLRDLRAFVAGLERQKQLRPEETEQDGRKTKTRNGVKTQSKILDFLRDCFTFVIFVASWWV